MTDKSELIIDLKPPNRSASPYRRRCSHGTKAVAGAGFGKSSGTRLHEIKHDGYRLIVCRRGGRVRLFTRRGYDWTDRYPLIRAAAEALPVDATIDGEAVVLDDAGLASFELMHSREHALARGELSELAKFLVMYCQVTQERF
jgi:bifunctional non-homologous end joining protein LigD